MAFFVRIALAIRSVVPALVAGCVILASSTGHAQQAGWDISKFEGREYVSVESIKKFYNFNTMTRSGNQITLENSKVEMNLEIGGVDCLMNRVKFVFTNKVESIGSKAYVSRMDLAKLIDPVLRPNFIKNAGEFRTVILDPGHGGKDPGATNPLGTEAAYNLKVAGLVKSQLLLKGFKVVMTRDSDHYLSLQERVSAANAVKENAIYISIHFNSGGNAARGIETFTLSPPGVAHYGRGVVAGDAQARVGNEHDSANIALATAVHGSVLRNVIDAKTKKSYTLDRGIKRARYSVLTGVSHPAILFEGGFMSHPYESKLINNAAYQKAIANGIVSAVGTYLNAVNPKAAAQ